VHRMRVRQAVHYLAAALGIALLVVLVRRTGTGTVIHQVKIIGWGFGLVLLLGGIGHLIKTWAWRLTFACEIKNISFAPRLRFGWFLRLSLFSDFLVK